MSYCIGVDLGGTNIAIGIVDLKTKRIVKKGGMKTRAPRSCDEISSDIVSLCKKLISQINLTFRNIEWIGVAAPGILKDGVVVSASNLGWKNQPLAYTIAKLSGVPTFATNDANAAAYAEAIWGVGRGHRSLVMLTLGTGVGGGIVIDGKIWEGTNGFAGEIGHVIVDMDGRVCNCGKRGCLEAYCSSTSLVSETKRIMKLYPDSIMWQMCEGDLNRINGITPFKARNQADEAAGLILDDFVKFLARGVSNIINILQPDIVCIGGGISAEGDAIMIPLRERVERMSFGENGRRTEIKTAKFFNDAGIIGGALLGMQKGKV